MKTVATFFNNYEINQSIRNVNTNASIARVECERNVCEKELYRLRYGLENLLVNKGHYGLEIRKKSWIDRCWPCCRRWNKTRNDDNTCITDEFTYRYGYDSSFQSPPFSDSFIPTSPLPYIDRTKHNISDLRTAKSTNDPTYKSLLFKILEAKVLDCFYTNQRIDKNPSDSISITSPSVSSLSPHLITPQLSSTETVSSIESSSISAFPSGTSTPNNDLTVSKLTPKNNLSKANEHKMSTLAVPVVKTLQSKKSKKRKNSSLKNKRSQKSVNIKKRMNKRKITKRKKAKSISNN